MKIITQDELVKEVENGLKRREGCDLVVYTKNQVNYGLDDKPNFEYCNANNIKCYDIGRRGGTFVINKGDVGFGCVDKGLDNTKGEVLYNSFVEYLRNKGLNVDANGNDITIDGYKVFGWSSNYYKEYDATLITAHFTMSVNLDLIKNICTKPMVKIPKGLSEYGITADEIKEFIGGVIDGLQR